MYQRFHRNILRKRYFFKKKTKTKNIFFNVSIQFKLQLIVLTRLVPTMVSALMELASVKKAGKVKDVVY